MIKWNDLSAADLETIHDIAKRITSDFPDADMLTVEMDLSACHLLNPLRLSDMLTADRMDLCHDVFGIMRHINRNTGELRNCFSPRFSS